MACNHPIEALVGTADGIFCSACGAKIEPAEPKPVKKAELKDEPEAELKDEPEAELKAEEKPKKAAPKRGGKK